MTDLMNPAMAEAIRLTRTGNLMQATQLIQRSLAGLQPSRPMEQREPSRDRAGRPVPRLRQVIGPKPDIANFRLTTEATALETGFARRRFQSNGRTLDYMLHVPRNAHDGMPLVVMLHGCTQSPEDFARGTGMNDLAEEFGFLVAYPAQASAANAQKCWNWFRPGDQKRDLGEPALIAGITREVIAEHAADPTRVYVAGLSAGGAAAAIMAAAYPDIYAAIGVHSGLACGSARDLASALQAMRTGGNISASTRGKFVPTITFHGDRDAAVYAINSQNIVEAATKSAAASLAVTRETGRSHDGRSYTRELRSDQSGHVLIEQWTIHGASHAWSGGNQTGSYADPKGPNASREMLRFFFSHTRSQP